MMKQFLQAGKIVALHGVRGEMRLKPWSDDADFLKQFDVVYFDACGQKPCRLLSARAHGNVTLIRLEGVDSAEKAEKLRGTVLYIDRSGITLPSGQYFISDIIGMQAVDVQSGEVLGEICDVQSYPANDVWHIKTANGTVLVPKTDEIVKKVDLEQRKAYIFKMKGLFEDEN